MNHSVSGAVAATALLLAAAPAFAQTAAPAPRPAPAPAPATVVSNSEEKRFDIELVNATAEKAVALLAQKTGHPVNVIFTGDSKDTPLPTLQLRNVTLSEFFAALRAAGTAEARDGRIGYEVVEVNGAPNIYTFSVLPSVPNQVFNQFRIAPALEPAVPRTVVGSVPAPVLSPQVAVEPAKHAAVAPPPLRTWANVGGGGGIGMAPPRAPEKSTLFFDLSKILDKNLTVEDITTAIRTGWEAAGDGKEPAPEALKFHQESKLLIATGPPDRLESVSNIIRLLENRNLPNKDAQERTIESLRLRIEEAAEQNQRVEAKLNEAEKLKDAMVRDLRDQIAKLEIELAKRARTP